MPRASALKVSLLGWIEGVREKRVLHRAANVEEGSFQGLVLLRDTSSCVVSLTPSHWPSCVMLIVTYGPTCKMNAVRCAGSTVDQR